MVKTTILLLIVSQWVRVSYQQCLDTTRIRGSLFAFALAPVEDIRNPLGPQEACYYSCGGQVVTHSSNKGDMARLTLMDKSAPILTDMGFLKSGQVYLLVMLHKKANTSTHPVLLESSRHGRRRRR
jgi:hypothetical protein